jgi:NAD(P)-dependent dehydrogenase (short-subunit alcohol dehydrogenase family)
MPFLYNGSDKMTAVYAIYPSLRGRSVFISGGATGIGRSFVEHFAGQGARVGFVDIDGPAGEHLADQASSYGEVSFASCDVADPAALQSCIRRFAETAGGLDVLINNAASDDRHSLDDVRPDYWQDRMQVNLHHHFFAAQIAAKLMQSRGGGSIINLGSIMVRMGAAGAVAYVTAKGAIEAMTRALARELGPRMIRVNCLVPGWIMTEKQIERYLDAAGEQRLRERQCLPVKLVPADVARMALFLAADDSAHCTSQSFIVDGGWV